jgi:HEAT repeat protein
MTLIEGVVEPAALVFLVNVVAAACTTDDHRSRKAPDASSPTAIARQGPKSPGEISNWDGLEIELDQSGGYCANTPNHYCPSYTVQIAGNGSVSFSTHEGPGVEGWARPTIPKETVRHLVEAALWADFFHLEGGEVGLPPDAGKTKVTMTVDSHRNQVMHAQGYPKRFGRFERMIEDAVFVRNWEGGPFSPGTLDRLERDIARGSNKRRLEAARRIAQLGLEAADAAPALVDVIANEAEPSTARPSEIASAVEDALARIGHAAVPPLEKLLAQGKPAARVVAARTLGEMGTEAGGAATALAAALKDSDEAVRSAAARALGLIGFEAITVVPALVSALADPSGSVRGASAWSLGEIGPAAGAARPLLGHALRDQDASVRLEAAAALFKIDSRDKRALDLLIAALQDREASQREQAVRCLGEIGPAAKAALPALEKARRDPQNSRLYFGEALMSISGPPFLHSPGR